MINVEFLKDESLHMGFCEKVITVNNSCDIEKALKEDGCITAQGNRTGITGAAIPEKGTVLSFSFYNGFTGMEYKNGTYYLQMKAGTTLAEIDAAIRNRKFDVTGWDRRSVEVLNRFQKDDAYFFPPDPTEKTATIGGMLATNAGGPASFYYGRTGKYIEKVKLWLADGTCHQIGRGECISSDIGEWKLSEDTCVICKPITCEDSPEIMQFQSKKDLIDLLAGSEGMIGIVEEVTIRLKKVPANCWFLIFYFKNEHDSLVFQDRIIKEYVSQWDECNLIAMDYLDSEALELVNWGKQYNSTLKKISEFPEKASAAVYMELHSEEEEKIEEVLYEILQLYSEYGEEEYTWAASTYDEAEKFRILRHGVPESVNAKVAELKRSIPGIKKYALDLFLPKMQIEESVNWIRSMIKEKMMDESFLYTIFGHSGERIYHVNLLPQNVEQCEAVMHILRLICEESMAHGGYVCSENGVGKTKKELFAVCITQEQKSSIESIKKGFDPKGRLNPGNMI